MTSHALKCEICEKELPEGSTGTDLQDHLADEHRVHSFGIGSNPEPYYIPVKHLDDAKVAKKTVRKAQTKRR